MDLNTAEKDIETLFSEFSAALGPVNALVDVISPFLPPQAKVAIAVLKVIESTGPTIIADVKKLAADVEAAIATISPPPAA